jgi:lysophospholipase L1-like esterase
MSGGADGAWARYLALGDSVSEGVGDDAEGVTCRSWADWLVDGLRETAPRLEYRNVALRGATCATVLDQQLPEIARLSPDLVSVTIGGNDARVAEWTAPGFEAEYSAILEAIASAGALALTATYADVEAVIAQAGGTIRDSWRLYFERMHEVNAVIRDVSARYDACLVDMESTAASDPRYLSSDFTHPNALAYRMIGQFALDALAARAEAG